MTVSVRVLGDSAFVELTRKASHLPRRFTLVDLEDFERVTRSKWYAAAAGKRFYIHATGLKFLANHHELLHAYVMRVAKGERVDHISGDTFDNRKQNLRMYEGSGNAQNRLPPALPSKTSRFKGVCWSKRDERWVARIKAEKVTHSLGHFKTEEDAALAYDEAAERLHGEFARTNATMKLFEMDDPFVPDCSWAKIYDRLIPLDRLSPHRHIMAPTTYDRRLTARLKQELAA